MMNLKFFLAILALHMVVVRSVSPTDSCFSHSLHDAILAKVFTSDLSDDDIEELIKQGRKSIFNKEIMKQHTRSKLCYIKFHDSFFVSPGLISFMTKESLLSSDWR
ncbi:uncharacterized protein LOC111344800 [Stylophora pistillata]|uniref:uncharacterized protein LOC111344800 n=1 Tax=Stylophora pistillata TaxID=50429 RepID=UPI000C04D6A3|nr:uncharacterized protein LOC111344800 [Stylophora pistillata]